MDKNEEIINFYKVPHLVDNDEKFKNLSDSAKDLYRILCKLTNIYKRYNGWFYQSIEELEKVSGKSKCTIIRAKKELIKNNFIEVKRNYDCTGSRRCDNYKVNGFEFK